MGMGVVRQYPSGRNPLPSLRLGGDGGGQAGKWREGESNGGRWLVWALEGSHEEQVMGLARAGVIGLKQFRPFFWWTLR